MKRAAIVIVVIVIAVVAWLAFGRNNPSTNQVHDHGGASTGQNNPASQPVSTDQVSIANFAFSPAAISVKRGTKVTWTNNDTVSHTVTENDGKNGPSAPPLSQGQTYSFTFNQTGTFRYHCSIHPEMTGTVTVTD